MAQFFASLKFHILKAIIFNILMITMDQITMCNVEGATCSDKPTDNYYSILQFSSTVFQCLLTHCFGFLTHNFGSLSLLL